MSVFGRIAAECLFAAHLGSRPGHCRHYCRCQRKRDITYAETYNVCTRLCRLQRCGTVLYRCAYKSEKERMRAVRTALEFRMILNSDKEVVAVNLNCLHKSLVR